MNFMNSIIGFMVLSTHTVVITQVLLRVMGFKDEYKSAIMWFVYATCSLLVAVFWAANATRYAMWLMG